MPPKRDVQEERRAQIYQAALTCFHRKGYHLTTMDDIVVESGLSKGTLYWYFESKQDLFVSMLRQVMDQFGQEMASIAAQEGSAADKLRASLALFRAELTDVNSGETLTVADLQGKVVLVETMAIWCSNCLRQQQEVKALHEALGTEDDLVTLVLDIDPNENAQNLKDYAASHGFDWTYVVAPREVAREIGQLYGDQFLNPPSTPMLIVDRHGEVHLLPFGRKSADDLQEALTPFLNGGT